MSDYKPVQTDLRAFKKLLLSDAATKREYDALGEEFELIAEMIGARRRAAKTQREVAELMHTTPSVVSRLESFAGQEKHSPKLVTLRRYAHALGCCLSIKFIPERHANHETT